MRLNNFLGLIKLFKTQIFYMYQLVEIVLLMRIKTPHFY